VPDRAIAAVGADVPVGGAVFRRVKARGREPQAVDTAGVIAPQGNPGAVIKAAVALIVRRVAEKDQGQVVVGVVVFHIVNGRLPPRERFRTIPPMGVVSVEPPATRTSTGLPCRRREERFSLFLIPRDRFRTGINSGTSPCPGANSRSKTPPGWSDGAASFRRRDNWWPVATPPSPTQTKVTRNPSRTRLPGALPSSTSTQESSTLANNKTHMCLVLPRTRGE